MSFDIYLFGSITRGEVSPSSDVDILVVPGSEKDVGPFPSSWSVYSRATLREYFIRGRLFAWHLHLHAIPVYCSNGKAWLDSLGQPHEYDTYREDILGLHELLKRSLGEIRMGTPNLVYEFGLVYTALRDIAMSASLRLTGQHNFSRLAPYQLPLSCPLNSSLYMAAMAARHASTRGALCAAFTAEDCEELLDCKLDGWIDLILDSL